jgi:hypothetical protein
MRPIDRPLALLGAVVAASLLSVSPLAAQCVISGPSVLCGGTARLCAPEGNYAAEWIGPSGFSSTDLCITVSEPGTYSLFLFDLSTGGGLSCDHTLSPGTPPAASISGPASACNGTAVSLCGPTGDFEYAWGLPGGGTATGACIAAAASGSYSLVVTDRTTGCVSTPAVHDFAFTNCDTTPPPPPPPPPGSIACPRTASFWSAQCRESSGGSRRIGRDLMEGLTSCVDEHSSLFGSGNSTSEFCAALKHGTHPALTARTVRQFTAVLANVCAAEIGLTAADGSLVGVSADQPLTMAGGPATVGDWVAQADAQLVQLSSQQRNDPGVEDAYRAILRTAWLINHGEAITVSCPAVTRLAGVVSGRGFDDMILLEPDDRSLAAALAPVASDLRLEQPSPNPFRGQTRIAWSLDTATPMTVRIVIHDLAGRAIRVLSEGVQSPGMHELWWDGRDNDGRTVAGGMYFVRATTGGRLLQTRLTMMR